MSLIVPLVLGLASLVVILLFFFRFKDRNLSDQAIKKQNVIILEATGKKADALQFLISSISYFIGFILLVIYTNEIKYILVCLTLSLIFLCISILSYLIFKLNRVEISSSSVFVQGIRGFRMLEDIRKVRVERIKGPYQRIIMIDEKGNKHALIGSELFLHVDEYMNEKLEGLF